jgi:hypothetical protein
LFGHWNHPLRVAEEYSERLAERTGLIGKASAIVYQIGNSSHSIW